MATYMLMMEFRSDLDKERVKHRIYEKASSALARYAGIQDLCVTKEMVTKIK